MHHLHIDLETKSAVDLRSAGVYRYAEDPSTDVWTACFAMDDSMVQRWFPGDPVPQIIAESVGDPDVHFVAHNYTFERRMWHGVLAPRYHWPLPELDQWECTMAHGMMLSLPRSLGNLALALGQAEQKDDEGHKLMLKMCRPRFSLAPTHPQYESFCQYAEAHAYTRVGDAIYSHGVTWLKDKQLVHVWFYTPGMLKRLADYCVLDVEAERGAHARLNRMRPMPESERKVFILDAKINDRGLKIDLPSVKRALSGIGAAYRVATTELRDIAGCSPSQVSELVKWLNSKGVKTDSVSKHDVEDLLSLPDIAQDVRRALEIRRDAGQSANRKYKSMVDRACFDGCIYGEHLYHAAHTGRFAGQGVQVQNMMRPTDRFDLDDAIDVLIHGENWSVDEIKLIHGDVFGLIGELTRNMIMAREGHIFRTADFSNIEGRVNAWLSGEKRKLEIFRQNDMGLGADPYLINAATIYKVPLESLNKKSPERQTGKVAELACGYQGAVGAFRKMAAAFSLTFTDAEILAAVRGWRTNHPNIVNGWYEAEDAAFKAVENYGQVVQCYGGRIQFIYKGVFLWARLPSGRLLAYCRPAIKPVTRSIQARDAEGNLLYNDKNEPVMKEVTRESVTYWAVDSTTKKWAIKPAYGGLWCENFVQAISRDLLIEAMFRAEAAGYPVVLHAHDELVAETPIDFGSTKEFEQIMGQASEWTPGLPVTAQGWSGPRYRK